MNIDQNSQDRFNKHICNVCGKQTLTEKRLKEHQYAVHESKEFKCTRCGKRLKSKSNLSQHIRAVHEGVKYRCRQCDHRATSKGSLTRHRRAVHEILYETSPNKSKNNPITLG